MVGKIITTFLYSRNNVKLGVKTGGNLKVLEDVFCEVAESLEKTQERTVIMYRKSTAA